jgi:hypothetical protein
MESKPPLKLYFSDYFEFPKGDLDKYGAFDISLVADLPLFIDPFLLFQSKKPEYQALHLDIIHYLEYLRDLSISQTINLGRLQSLFYFSEVKQTYLGFTYIGNKGHGLGHDFARALNANLSNIFSSFGKEIITRGIHLEKLCLISKGVGRDMISDFVTNLIKEYLLSYTQEFAKANIQDKFKAQFNIRRVKFNRQLGIWTTGTFTLPVFRNDYVILTPKDMLTRHENWISRADYLTDFFTIVEASSSEQLRADLNSYLIQVLSKKPTREEIQGAIEGFTRLHPELIDYFIRAKEDNGDKAVQRSAIYVAESEQLFREQFGSLAQYLWNNTLFYQTGLKTKTETYKRIMFLKDSIENQGCWKIFYNKNKPVTREEDIHILFRLVWYGTILDVSHEVNNGVGPVDFKISYGQKDKTLVEFKLAKNTHLRTQLQTQLELYKKASGAEYGYKVIIYFTGKELAHVKEILKDLQMENDPNIILIDARPKVSASLAH